MLRYFKHRGLFRRVDQQPARAPLEMPQPHPDTAVIRASSHGAPDYDDEEDEYDENEPAPDPEKDDMMARRTGSYQKTTSTRANQSANQFLPVPGSVRYSVAPVSPMKPLHSRAKLADRMASERYERNGEMLYFSHHLKEALAGADGLIKLTSFMACSTNINKSLCIICPWSKLFCLRASMFECLQLDA